MMCAVQAHVKIGCAAIAAIPKAERLAGRERNFGLAGMALHPASLRQNLPVCQSERRPGRKCAG